MSGVRGFGFRVGGDLSDPSDWSDPSDISDYWNGESGLGEVVRVCYFLFWHECLYCFSGVYEAVFWLVRLFFWFIGLYEGVSFFGK